MDQKLPENFDLIIIGTGFIESVISAAASRVGKSVLHVDSKDYYGGQWASFNLEALKTNPPDIPDFECDWTEESEALLKDSRKFNIDLVPKVHYARGDFVELLISSNIARYTEFRSVSRILTSLNGQLEVVPCSRSDVFANNKVSVIEKRMLMKLLTSLEDIVVSDPNQTFKDFLLSKKLSDNLVHFVLYAMARSTSTTPVSEGIENTKRFLTSLGRFGKTPFLFSMYGSGETPQAFCRLSAVFGGTFALNLPHSLKVENNRAEALVLSSQEVVGKHFVLGEAEFLKGNNNKEGLSRAVFITDKSIMTSESEHLTMLIYPPEQDKGLVTVLELGGLTGTCPKNLFLVHMICKQITKPKEDFAHVVANLFPEVEDSPKILWSSYFTLPDSSSGNSKDTPENVFLCPGPDLDLDYDSSIKKAKNIFENLYPGEEFLPRAPDPEEIIIGDECVQDSVDFRGEGDVESEEKVPSVNAEGDGGSENNL